MLGLRTERLIFFLKIFNNLTVIGPELTENKRNLNIFDLIIIIQNKHSQSGKWKFSNDKFIRKYLNIRI